MRFQESAEFEENSPLRFGILKSYSFAAALSLPAVAIKDGKFLVVGSNADVGAVTGDATEVGDLGRRMAMPGLVDAHVHPLGVANSWANL